MLTIVCLAAGISYLSIMMIKFCLAMAYYRRQTTCPCDDGFSSVHAKDFCVVQPILSGDPMLESTLRSNLRSLPKNVTLFWMVDIDDPNGIDVCERLRKWQSLEEEQLRIFLCPPSPLNQNPKSWKLSIALEACNHRYIAVLDDDTAIDEKCLAAAWSSLQTFSLYTGLPLYRRGKSVWSDLVTHFVVNNSILTYLPPLMLFEPLTINGMFYATRCETLRSLGGFTAIANELCDDYAIKKLFGRAGKRIHQGITFQEISTSVGNFGEYWRLLHRWNVFALQLFRDQRLIVQSFLAVFLGLPPVLLLVCLTTSFFHSWSFCFLLLLLVGRDALLRITQRIVFRKAISMNSFYSLSAECLQLFHLISALINPTIRWRHRTIRVGCDMR